MDQTVLTPREQDILKLLCEGYSNSAIAENLVIALDTVKWYNTQIYSKLHVKNRTQAVLYARQHTLVTTTNLFSATSTRLPNPLTSFVGRAKILQEICNRLQQDRLISIVGPGGVGKTRLAIQVAHHHGLTDTYTCYYVPLAPVSSDDQFLQAIATAMGSAVQDQIKKQQQVINILSRQPTFLILDNFEHILQANIELDTLLRAVPDLHVLVTSRERLNLKGEVIFSLMGLDAPQNEQLAEIQNSDAVNLFINRAQYNNHSFIPTEADMLKIAHICRLLDGMPLAIEHIASWMHVIDLSSITSEINQSLDILNTTAANVEKRHRSMRSVIDHSWQRLTDTEKQVLMRLSIFRGGFQRDGAQMVANATLPILSALVMKSFVYRVDDERYDIHELQRQFALEKLGKEGIEREAKEQHAQFYADLIDDICPKRYEFKEYNVASLDRLDAEYDNIREAILWALHHGDEYLAMQILAEGRYFYADRGHHVDGEKWIRLTFSKCTNPDPLLLIKAYLMQAQMSRLTNEGQLFLNNPNNYLSLAEQVAVPEYIAHTHILLGRHASYEKQFDIAKRHIKQGLQIITEHRDQFPGTYGVFLNQFAHVLFESGELDLAIDYLEKSCDSWRKFNGRFVERLVRLIQWLRLAGKTEQIPGLLQEALDNALYFASPVWTMSSLQEVASYFLEKNELAIAVTLSAVSWQLHHQTNHDPDQLQLIIHDLQQNMETSTFDTLWQDGLGLPVNDAIGLAQDTLEDLL